MKEPKLYKGFCFPFDLFFSVILVMYSCFLFLDSLFLIGYKYVF